MDRVVRRLGRPGCWRFGGSSLDASSISRHVTFDRWSSNTCSSSPCFRATPSRRRRPVRPGWCGCSRGPTSGRRRVSGPGGRSSHRPHFEEVVLGLGRVLLDRIPAGPLRVVLGLVNLAFVGTLQDRFAIPGRSANLVVSEYHTVPNPATRGGGSARRGKVVGTQYSTVCQECVKLACPYAFFDYLGDFLKSDPPLRVVRPAETVLSVLPTRVG